MKDLNALSSRRQWILLFLLALSAVLNYVCRGSLSIAAPSLTGDLKLSPVQLGVAFSGFFWSYAAFQIPAGWLVDRFNVKWVFAAGFFIWTGATFAAGFATSMTGLMCMLLLLGMGESVAFPSYSKVIASTFPIDRRGLPNSLIDAGTKLGPALGTLAGGLLVANFGWRSLFLCVGAGSVLWLIPWLIWAPKFQSAPAAAHRSSAGFLQIVKRREAWGTFIGNGCYLYAYFFLLTWLPSYLVKERHVSLHLMGILASVPFWGSAVAAVTSGWASDRWIRRGGSPTLVRKTFVVSGLLGSTVMVGAVIVHDLSLSIVFLSLGYVAFGVYASNLWAITQTLAGPGAVGKWAGMQNTIGSLTGTVAPVATGFIVAKTGSFFWAFVSPAVLAVIGACCYSFLIGPIAPIRWNEEVPQSQPAVVE
jgi:ACS family D-galactonate transporter-like MFS transporter